MLNKEELTDSNRVTYFALTDFRGKLEKFGIKAEDRTRHMYVIGKTGMGKSTLLENMAIQDIQNGEGLCFIDPHGTTADKLLKYVPKERLHDVIYFTPFDTKYPMGLNILEHVDEDYRHLVASGLMDAFKKVFGEDVFSGRMVYLLNNAILSLLENKGENLMGINRIFADKEYRKKIISNVKNPALLSFWNEEYAKYDEKYVREATAAIQNKIGQFIMTPLVRNIVGQEHTSFDIRDIMDKRKILICNLSLGQTGSENVNLIGSLLITKIYLAAMSRANLKEDELKNSAPFYFYVDEFQNFVNDSFAQILSQARKYNLGLVIAHQYVEQLTDNVKAAVFGNVGSMLSFRVGAGDAEMLEKEYAPQFTAEDIVNLGVRQIYLRLSISGVGSKPFSAKTMPPIESEDSGLVPAVIASSRAIYAREKAAVEEEISKWYAPAVNVKDKNSEYAKDRIENKNSAREAVGIYAQPKRSQVSPERERVASVENSRRGDGGREYKRSEGTKREELSKRDANLQSGTYTQDVPKIENRKTESVKSPIENGHTEKETGNSALRNALKAALEVDNIKIKEKQVEKVVQSQELKAKPIIDVEKIKSLLDVD